MGRLEERMAALKQRTQPGEQQEGFEFRYQQIEERAMYWVKSVPYPVTLRWVGYRMLGDNTLRSKSEFPSLAIWLSDARKQFHGEWTPWTLVDDTRRPILVNSENFYTYHFRSGGFDTEEDWRASVVKELNCPLDRWATQPYYIEMWVESTSMEKQFIHYANKNIPLVAFKGQYSIPGKWETAKRLSDVWKKYHHPIRTYYYGDCDKAGKEIPQNAWNDIYPWVMSLAPDCDIEMWMIGLTRDQAREFSLIEKPEKPGNWEWEALSDTQAKSLIERANELLDLEAFKKVEVEEDRITKKLRHKLGG